jgi:hypothetical protein
MWLDAWASRLRRASIELPRRGFRARLIGPTCAEPAQRLLTPLAMKLSAGSRAMLAWALATGCSAKSGSDQAASKDAVRNGIATSDYDKSVFMQTRASDPYQGARCTGWNAVYPRCIVTASHCLGGTNAHDNTYYAGAEPRVNSPTKKSQTADRQAYIPFDSSEVRSRGIHAMRGSFSDLGVAWLQGLRESREQARLLPESDYAPFDLLRPFDHSLLGLPSTKFGKVAPGVTPFPITAIGYGLGGDDSPAGIKR